MNFVTYKELVRDCKDFSNQLPSDIRQIVGIPRSGMIPASLIGLHRNIPVYTFSEYINHPSNRPMFPRASYADGKTLILDDSINSGTTLTKIRQKIGLSDNIIYGSIYFTNAMPGQEYGYRQLSTPRFFEWNLFHQGRLARTILDMDGVLCEDPSEIEPDEDWTAYFESVKPLNIPTVKCLAICTSRLEKYREVTEDWLRRHNIEYGKLVMSPHETASARRLAADSARLKATFYQTYGTGAWLFIESSRKQADQIHTITGRPVLCLDDMTLHSNEISRA